MKRFVLLLVLFGLLAFGLPALAQQAVFMTGRDLAVPIHGTGLLVFGDTVTDGGTAPNSLATTAGVAVKAPAWLPIPPASGSMPTGGMRIGGCLYVWNENALSASGNSFDIASSGIAVSCDGGATWTEHLLFDGPTPFSQATPYGQVVGGYVYLLGTSGGRMTPAILARVPSGQVTNGAAYRFWNGAAWGGMAGAIPVISDTVGELSVSWNTYRRVYLVMYQSPASGGVVYRTAPTLSGPWSAASVVVPQSGSRFYAPMQVTATTGRVVDYLLSDYEIYSVIWMRLAL